MSSGFMLRAMRLAGRDELRLSGRIEGRWRVRERGDAPPSGGRRLLNQIRGALLDRLVVAPHRSCPDVDERPRPVLCRRPPQPNTAGEAAADMTQSRAVAGNFPGTDSTERSLMQRSPAALACYTEPFNSR